MTGSNLTDQQLQQIVDKTIIYLDKDADGKISFDEFKNLVEARGTVHKMSMDIPKIWEEVSPKAQVRFSKLCFKAVIDGITTKENEQNNPSKQLM